MYQAKLAGKNRYSVFDAELDRTVRGYHESLGRIRRALDAREFVLHYQPKVNMRTGTLIGAEALIRWQHPDRGLLPPAAFLPMIEDHPLAVEVGEWVIETALSQAEIPTWVASWRPDPVWLGLAPVSRDAVPLLFAGAAHRAWIAAVEGYLRGEREAPPPLDEHQCGFGVWLDAAGRGRPGAWSGLQVIDASHQRAHALAVALCQLRAQGREPEALIRLGELRDLRDAVLERLKTLVQVNPGVATGNKVGAASSCATV